MFEAGFPFPRAVADRKVLLMTAPRQRGWYDDPHDSNAQRYWDGQHWTPHRQRKLTLQSAPPPSPPPPVPSPSPPPPAPSTGLSPSPTSSTPPTPPASGMTHMEKGRRFWLGLPRGRRVMVAIAGLFVAVAVIAVPFVVVDHVFGGASTTSHKSDATGHQNGAPDGQGGAPVDTSSRSYKMGLKSGTDGNAEIAAFGSQGLNGRMQAPMPPHQACQGSFDLDSGGLIAGVDEQLNEQDYLAGCLYGLSHNANANHPTR